jgi:hypothetical protein
MRHVVTPLPLYRRKKSLAYAWSAASASAEANCSGSSRPRRSARRRIPRHALGLKEYFGGTDASKISDNEHATAALGDSEVLSVKDAVGPPIPELPQRPEDGSKVPSAVARQKARDVFEQKPVGSE